MVFEKIRRPSMTPSASTPRSLSSSTTSAASFATSVPESTEMPTSAWCRATASFTPSPRKATSLPVRRATLMIRDFSSGPMREKIVVSGMAAASSSSVIARTSAPFTRPVLVSPISSQTLAATSPLSPVMIFTSMPRRRSRSMDWAASSFTRSAKVKSPSSVRLVSRSGLSVVGVASGRLATAITLVPWLKSSSRRDRVEAVTSRQWLSTASGAPLVIISSSSDPRRTSTETIWRSWSNGRMAWRTYWLAALDDASFAPFHRAWSSALPPTGPCSPIEASLQTRPKSTGCTLSSPWGSKPCSKVMAPSVKRAGLVGEEDLDVAEILDRDQSLDQDLVSGQRLRARREADRHDRRHHLGRDADGDGQREEQRLEQRPVEGDVDDEDARGQECGDLEQEAREAREARLERRPCPPARSVRRRSGQTPCAARSRRRRRRPSPGGRWCPCRRTWRVRRARPRRGPRSIFPRASTRPSRRPRRTRARELKQPKVGRHQGADAQRHDVARDEVGDGDLAGLVRRAAPARSG